MDNVLLDRSSSGLDVRRAWTDGNICRTWSFGMSRPMPHISHNSFAYATSPLHQIQYAPPYLHSSLSLPPLPPRRPPLLATKAIIMYATPPPAAATKPAHSVIRRTVSGDSKRKNPRAPRARDEPARGQRRKPLERAAPLPPAPAVDEALDDLEREVVRGFVEDLVHVLAPPPSSLPLPTFTLVKAKAAAAPCAV
ncbi:hypothetical protein QOZ80_2BG0173840 [Eleusine coracana subsp. coracana]|nr:hypothetical protein QOZ80_2BG0173840 [Eleusine coracana subsp. coracana]